MRLRGRRDANHKEIVLALRQVGATVLDLGNVGDGCPDVAVGFRKRWTMLEIKVKDGKVRESQAALYEHCAAPVHVVRSVPDALRAIGAI